MKLSILILLISINSIFSNEIVYKSSNIEIIKISDNIFQHISYLETEKWGRVSCNGMIFKSNDECVVFDTTPNDSSSLELINVIDSIFNVKIKFLVVNHFHGDCLGGVKSFINSDIKVVANKKTIDLARKDSIFFDAIIFENENILEVGGEKVVNRFLGEGHTQDNIVSFIISKKVLFGGCLVKELGASKGYLEDANINEWARTIERVREVFPKINMVVPGHGKAGSIELLEYTKELFDTK